MTEHPAPRLDPAFVTLPLAHRALHDSAAERPENSRAAILAAVEAGYGIEIDLQLSADGAAMVFHDYDLDRLTGESGRVATRDAAVLGQIPLKGGDGEGIPTLSEILALVAGRVPLLIEIKDQDRQLGRPLGRLEAAAARAVAGYAGPVAFMSFNPEAVARMAALCPDVPRGLTTAAFDDADWDLPPALCAHLRGVPDYTRVGASFISHEWRDLDRARVAELAGQGAAILCWTIRSPSEEAQARRIAQNITFEGYAAPRGA